MAEKKGSLIVGVLSADADTQRWRQVRFGAGLATGGAHQLSKSQKKKRDKLHEQMVVAGKALGEARKQELGHAGYEELGRKGGEAGGARVRHLVKEGKEAEREGE